LAGHDAAPPLPVAAPPSAGAAALPLALADAPPPVDALADAPVLPSALGAAGLAPVLPAGLAVVPPPPHAASVTLSSVTTLIEPHRWLNRTFIP
jgi:hypothetical protein